MLAATYAVDAAQVSHGEGNLLRAPLKHSMLVIHRLGLERIEDKQTFLLNDAHLGSIQPSYFELTDI